jgi:hypothetical protein
MISKPAARKRFAVVINGQALSMIEHLEQYLPRFVSFCDQMSTVIAYELSPKQKNSLV